MVVTLAPCPRSTGARCPAPQKVTPSHILHSLSVGSGLISETALRGSHLGDFKCQARQASAVLLGLTKKLKEVE